ncbi:hypothetical protein [Phytohabitans houttuyneae]|uniref:Uncharacterized protein n=1 Tax=Phytohabitans houttuyneae TaxID=1076126 RepID=A0A6V8K1J0_9ACTN|nr:hypothetical protein [Phytohabitans houttuyneae]GFJ77450.1 hypothetical protein Phou_016300 [Phytohabitans houttuyneae]
MTDVTSSPVPTTPADADAVPATAHDAEPAVQGSVVELILASAWFAVDGQAAPPPAWLRDIAARMIGDVGPLAGIDTPAGMHRWLVGFVDRSRADADAAHADAEQARQAVDDFHADVRRRAAQAIHAGQVCLTGTNHVLDELGVEELAERYRVSLLVPVTVSVYAHDVDEAYHLAEQVVRDDLSGAVVDIATGAMRQAGAEASGHVDPAFLPQSGTNATTDLTPAF